MQRVMIVGCPGAGKSTAARTIAARLGLPLVHLDYHYWQPGWVETEKAAWRSTVAKLIAEPQWVMDGNYGSTLPDRLARADMLIHLDFPTPLCLYRVVRRTIANHGRERPGEFVTGCPERFDADFLRFVWRYRRDHRPRDLAALSEFTGCRFDFRRPAQLRRFLRQL